MSKMRELYIQIFGGNPDIRICIQMSSPEYLSMWKCIIYEGEENEVLRSRVPMFVFYPIEGQCYVCQSE